DSRAYNALSTSGASLLFFSPARATAQIYTLSLHDALPISSNISRCASTLMNWFSWASLAAEIPRTSFGSSARSHRARSFTRNVRSEEHTSELQSLAYLVCRLLLEKKNR